MELLCFETPNRLTDCRAVTLHISSLLLPKLAEI